MAPAYRIDGRPATRAAFYTAACDPRRSVIVEACAGAGKTWMLVSRILRALLDGAQPHEILAITFTRKAAGEMRSRLAAWLREFAHGDEAVRVQALVERGVDERQARAFAPALAQLHEQVLASGRAVEVRTFHAWFSQLLRAAPLELLAELGLQPQMELVEDLDDLRPELFRRFHAALLADPDRRADYSVLLHRHGRHQLLKWLDAAWDKRIEIELADAAGTLDDGVSDTAVVWPERALFQALATELAAVGKARAVAAAQAIEAALGESDDEAAFIQLWQALHTGQDEPRKQLGDPPLLAEACEALQRTRDALDQRQAHDDHRRMARLARVLLAEYAALKRSRALADMADLERCALRLLADSDLAGWVMERLDARVRHVLIDEFQDTSPLQWHALASWLSSYAGAGGGRTPSVFIVGDPKQSIYRFRRAEPRVFDAARCFVEEGLGGQVLECDHTRRNAGAVLDALNAVFGELAREGAYDGFRPHTTEVAGVAGHVARLPGGLRIEKAKPAVAPGWRDSLATPRREPEEQLREEEARQVAARIHAMVAQDGVAPGEIFVLGRKRASLRLVGAALQALHLPFAAPEENLLAQLPEVRDLVALLDVLASPGHDLSLAQALKGPLFGASDADLLAIAQATGGRRGTWWQVLRDLPAPSGALERARGLLLRWAAAARELPPHDLLERIVGEGDLIARLAAAVPPERRGAALAAVDALLGQALQLDGGRYATPYNFVRALRARALKTAAVAQPDAVQLLTVHGAKGLEARVVFLVDADPERQNAESATLLVDWPVEHAKPQRVAFVASEARCPLSLRALLADENVAREREEWNGLYVAMTRARERLVFSRTEPLRALAGRSWWARVQPHVEPEPLPPAPALAAAATSDAEVVVLPPGPPGLIAVPAAQPVDDIASRLGQAVHRVLEWAAGRAVAPAQLADAAAAEFGLPASQAGAVAAFAESVLRAPALARFFDPAQLLWAGNEVPLAGPDGEVLRIDRLVRTTDAWWVLDYKLQSSPNEVPAWREQLARYRAAVQRLQPGDAVRAAFVSGRGELLEETNSPPEV
jgi:ATP-dependent helicase/nuclease subunit A